MAYDFFAGTNKLKKKVKDLAIGTLKNMKGDQNTYYGKRSTLKEGWEGMKEIVELARKKDKKKTWE